MKVERLHQTVSAIVLAGGMGRRVDQQDKGLLTLHNEPMISRVLDHLRENISDIVISANRNQSIYEQYGHSVIADEPGGFQGPLAGILSCLPHCKHDLIFLCPVDAPLLEPRLPELLYAHMQEHQCSLVIPHDGKRQQPLFSLMTRELAQSIRTFLDAGENRVMQWFSQHPACELDCSAMQESFTNVNTLATLQTLEQRS